MAPKANTYQTPTGPTWYTGAPTGYTAPSWAYAEAGALGAAKKVRDQERSRFGRPSTILTSGTGDTSPVPTQVRSLLGS